MVSSVAPTPEQRARDGRLAWIIVSVCGVVTLMLIVGLLYALGGQITRWAAQSRQQAARASTTASDGNEQTADDSGKDGARSPEAGTGPSSATRHAGTGDDGGTEELRKEGARPDNELHKSVGGGEDDGNDPPSPDADDDTPQPRRI